MYGRDAAGHAITIAIHQPAATTSPAAAASRCRSLRRQGTPAYNA